jgi:hypothetical protein
MDDAPAEFLLDAFADLRRRDHPHIGPHKDRKELVQHGVVDQLTFLLKEVSNIGLK